MALAGHLDSWLRAVRSEDKVPADLRARLQDADIGPVALPRRMVSDHHDHPLLEVARRIPAVLDAARESGDEKRLREDERLVRELFAGEGNTRQNLPRLETYYGLLLMDGDRMGAILSGESEVAISFRESFHPQVREQFDERARGQGSLKAYAEQRRPVSPNRHLTISAALSEFSQVVVPHIVEEQFSGRLIYSGGDDVLAMLPAADVLAAAARLRRAYSGVSPDDQAKDWTQIRAGRELACKEGFAWLRGRLMRMMGPRATASCGVVIAHHQAPLGLVLRELRRAEAVAKSYRRRDGNGRMVDRGAIHLTVLKRSGGKLDLSLDWGEPLALLEDLRAFLAHDKVSRRAVYLSLEWLEHVPEAGGKPDPELLQAMLAYRARAAIQGRDAREGAGACRAAGRREPAAPGRESVVDQLSVRGRLSGSRAAADEARRRRMKTVEFRLLEPVDVLMLRGNVGYGDPGCYGESQVPPWPSVIAGALRSRILVDDGVDLKAFGEGKGGPSGARYAGPAGQVLPGCPPHRAPFGRRRLGGGHPAAGRRGDPGKPRRRRPVGAGGGGDAACSLALRRRPHARFLPVTAVACARAAQPGQAGCRMVVREQALRAYLAGRLPQAHHLVEPRRLWAGERARGRRSGSRQAQRPGGGCSPRKQWPWSSGAPAMKRLRRRLPCRRGGQQGARRRHAAGGRRRAGDGHSEAGRLQVA